MPDTDPPEVINRSPGPGAGGVSKDRDILFSVVDVGVGVDLPTVQVWVRGFRAFNGVVFRRGWSLSTVTSDGSGGYDFRLVPDRLQYHREGELIVIRVDAADLENNHVSVTWSFRAVSNLGMRTYGMLLSGLRVMDETG